MLEICVNNFYGKNKFLLFTYKPIQAQALLLNTKLRKQYLS